METLRRTALIAAAAIALTGASLGVGFANVTPNLSLDEQLKVADVVIIGKAVGEVRRVDTPGAPRDGVGYQNWARLQVQTVLKGRPGGEVLVMTNPLEVELAPNCCTAGKTYFMALRRVPEKANEYVSVSASKAVQEVKF